MKLGSYETRRLLLNKARSLIDQGKGKTAVKIADYVESLIIQEFTQNIAGVFGHETDQEA